MSTDSSSLLRKPSHRQENRSDTKSSSTLEHLLHPERLDGGVMEAPIKIPCEACGTDRGSDCSSLMKIYGGIH